MQLDGLLTFLYGLVIVALSQFAALLVSYRVHGYHLGKVVLVAFFLLKRGVDVGQGTVIVGIVPCIE